MSNISEDKQSKSIGLGLVVGIAFGAATDNIGLGIALGLVFGAGIGTAKKCLIEKNLLINIGEPVAQLVEQWPFKPLVVSSSLTRLTLRKFSYPEEKPALIGGFFVSTLNDIISRSEYSLKRGYIFHFKINH